MLQKAMVNFYAGEGGDNFWWKTTPLQRGSSYFVDERNYLKIIW